MDYNKFSVELGGGFILPITPKEGIVVSDYFFPGHVDVGLRYMFNETIGVKVYYALDKFRNRINRLNGNDYHRISLVGVYNVTNSFNYLHTNYNIFVYGGVGISHSYPEAIKRFERGGRFTFGLEPNIPKRYERIGNLIFGVAPQYKLSDKFGLTFDVTYIYNRAQQYAYSGELLFESRGKVNGSFLNLSIGLQYYLGKNPSHSDWYQRGRKRCFGC